MPVSPADTFETVLERWRTTEDGKTFETDYQESPVGFWVISPGILRSALRVFNTIEPGNDSTTYQVNNGVKNLLMEKAVKVLEPSGKSV